MSTVITTFVHEKQCHVEVFIDSTALSMEQVQILSGIAYSLHQIDNGYLHEDVKYYTLKGHTMIDDYNENSLVWMGKKIAHVVSVDADTNNKSNLFNINRYGDYTILNGEVENVKLTFKNGMLESMGDEPAITVESSIDAQETRDIRIWFHANRCFRLANPKLPADISYCIHAHYNADGFLHRAMEEGPSIYVIADGKYLPGEYMFHINGQFIDMECLIDPITGMVEGSLHPVIIEE